jgi:hypothetical protein
LYNWSSTRIELASGFGLGVKLKPPDNEIHQVLPDVKNHIARQGANMVWRLPAVIISPQTARVLLTIHQ